MDGRHQASSNNDDASEAVSVMRLAATDLEGRSRNEVDQTANSAERDSHGAEIKGTRTDDEGEEEPMFSQSLLQLKQQIKQ